MVAVAYLPASKLTEYLLETIWEANPPVTCSLLATFSLTVTMNHLPVCITESKKLHQGPKEN